MNRRVQDPKTFPKTLALGLLLTGSFAAFSAFAGDPAYVGGSSGADPANLNYRARPVYQQPNIDIKKYQQQYMQQQVMQQQKANSGDAAKKLEALMQELSNETSVSGARESRAQEARYRKIREEADKLTRGSWGSLSPSTQRLYDDVFATGADALNQEDRGMYYEGDPGASSIRNRDDIESGMHQLADALYPVINDLKRDMEIELRNASGRRR